MKILKIIILTSAFCLTACWARGSELSTPTNDTDIPIHEASKTPHPTSSATAIPAIAPTITLADILTPTITETSATILVPSATPTPYRTRPPTSNQPGVFIHGTVTLPNGIGLPGVPIYYAFSAYPGNSITNTNENGEYSAFIGLAADELVRVWAESPDYTFKPGGGATTWFDHEFAWRHYSGYERVKLSFIAIGK